MPEPRDPYRVLRYVACGALEGAIAGWVFLFLLMAFDIQNIGTLIETVAEGQLMFILAVVMFGITFGMVGIGWRVMVLLPDEKEDDE